jgi:thiamine-monophosphate kinase
LKILHSITEPGVSCGLYEEHIPYDNQTKKMADELNINFLVAALNGGEDYELLFSLPVNDHSKIKNHPDITILGYITHKSKGINLITTGTALEIPLEAQGWNPLK